MRELIRTLTSTFGPCGQEEAVRALIKEELKASADEIRTDSMGNLIALKRGSAEENETKRRVMLAAHMDEIGVMVTHIDEKGFIRFTTVGSLLPYTLLGSQVRFGNGLYATFGMEGKPLAVEKPDINKMFLDIGASSREEAEINVGDVAVFRSPFVEQGDRLFGSSFDDRVGCAILIETFRQIDETPHDLFAVFTVQEEVGVRGATTAAFGVEPDLALALDVTPTGDFPEAHRMAVSLGEGPAIKVMDRRMIAHPGVRTWLVRSAEAYEIPYQTEVLEFGSTDAAAIQMSRAGVPSGALSIPSRYIHSPVQMVDYNDVQHSVRLLVNALSGPIEI